MSHVWCIECHGNEHVCGFGLAAGGYTTYTFCECGSLLECIPMDDDREGPLPANQCIPHGLENVGGQDEDRP
jgi:hypothetical protein